MRVEAKYEKTGRGTIVARLRVAARDDYVTENIFWGDQDLPTDPNFSLAPATGNYIEEEFSAAWPAESWIHRQVSALITYLNLWRDIDVPDIEEFFI